MKKLTTAVLLLTLFVTNANGQKDTAIRLGTSMDAQTTISGGSPVDLSVWSSSSSATRGNTFKIDTVNYLKIFAKATTEIIVLKSNGDLLFRPSEFCDCDKCKSHTELKFLYNIYKKQ